MQRRIPLTLVLVVGLFAAVAAFVPHPIVQNVDETLRNDVLRILSAFGLVLGIGSIVQHHLLKIRRHAQHWQYSYITIIMLIITAIVGVFGGIDPNRPGLLPTHIGSFSFHMQTLYTNVMVPLGATMFAMLAFFMASAAYRAFRAHRPRRSR